MRIAMVSAHTSPLAPLGGRETGGMNVYVLELSRELARLGYEVDIFTRLDGDLPPVEPVAPGLRLVRLPAGPPAPLEKEEIARHLPEFVRGLRAFACSGPGYDLIHSHYWQSGWAGTILARQLRLPHVVMFHTLGEVKNRARFGEAEPTLRIRHERTIARRATAIVTASDHERQLLERYYGADPARMHTVPCGIDLDLFRPLPRAEARASLGLPLDRPVLLWVGRLEKLKGLEILLDAVAGLERDDALLLIVGGDDRAAPLRAELEAQARALGIAGRVRFTGAVDHAALPRYYSAADVCVVPSFYESFGLVAVEAMACGTPVVASRVGGLVSTVIDGVTGYLIPWRCPEPFAEKLDVLLANPELRANFGRAARASVERFRWSTVGLRIADVYDAARARCAAPGSSAPPAIAPEAWEAAVIASS
ncbi:glycosyltransferase [Tepidiforma thermophila]|uniref:D-inositol-3-phosphate glycosyltransferase n=1 Tax=Tepidiforma thermophila (strain KCTC 52669 / CGMCC 1.13589 / G233) TaxID=2761530 RepID=A0A2A9HF18_TEPT2|nr:glycosyltransferase [Tepidiforma thermophila]PFG73576.1 D-inositol-3-phosphate glycosyltransferase [Tepidiforma thermophila]